ncbi:MFS transporter [Sphingorhabdus sp.]|uniref:MFS transporter n=1 Tax=Sphingorhabdus sp. TaxID=1902408 RepID=UPI0025D63B34|nr:MFS transporter [Sphingorhabdus sp.]
MYLYALAVSGSAVAYMPFLTILLPLRATDISGTDALGLLAIAAFLGAIAASMGNIVFGWASDKTGERRPWIWAGLGLSSALLLTTAYAKSPAALIAIIILWQFGLNMMLAPLTAWAGDSIPDSQKGFLGGLLALAPAMGALSGVFVTMNDTVPSEYREMTIAMLVIVMVSPVLIFGRPISMPALMSVPTDQKIDLVQSAVTRHAAVKMWIARLLVQIAEASLFAFLLLWFRSVDPDFGENDAANIFALALGMAVFIALAVGRWSDRENRPIFPLICGAAAASAGLIIMSVSASLPVAIAGYVVFGLASSLFLALHSSQTLRVLPRPHTRGRDLGIFNLTNTVPSLIMPWLTLAMVPAYGFGGLFLVLAGLAAIACLLLATMPRQRASS